jgi:hypothetical protein
MKIPFNDYALAYLALFTGLAISSVAIYYSVSGLVSIFAAAAIPIIIMGVVLEIGKLVATLWLKYNWKIAPFLLRSYLLISVIVLMFITSMGIFGFLSRAHIEQSLTSGDNTVMIAEFDRQISIEQRNIKDAESVISQLDQAVQSLTESERIRGRDGAIAVRRSQAAERAELTAIIQTSNTKISQLEKEKLPLIKQQLDLEAEVGPIKYIAALIYGDNPDKDLLEKAVRWVIIIIVAIFDPLAVILLLASQYSFQNIRERKLQYAAISNAKEPEPEVVCREDDILTEESKVEETLVVDTEVKKHEPEVEKTILEQHPYLNTPFSHFTNLEPMVAKPDFEDSNWPEVKEELDDKTKVQESNINNSNEDPIFISISPETGIEVETKADGPISIQQMEETTSPKIKEVKPGPIPKIEDTEEQKNYIVKEGEKQIKMVYIPSKKHE